MTLPDPQPPSAQKPAPSADALIRRLGGRYFFVLAVVAGLMLVDQALIQPLLVRMDSYAPVINLAGRQRMLSQKLAKAALAAEGASDAERRDASRQELKGALAEWIAANDALRQGSEQLNIPHIVSAELAREWAELDRDLQPIAAAAQEIVDGDADGTQSAATILAHESAFLQRMERIVDLFELEAAQEVSRLRVYSLTIAIAVASLLIILGWLVVRPATRAIRRQVDDLELRVSQRTAELAEMVASLQHEVAERKLAESHSRQLAAQLAHADRVASMGHLAIGLAHELNQPLGAIANYASAGDVLLSQAGPARDDRRLQQYLQQINEAALRAGQIVRRIRKFVSRTGADASDAVDVDLGALVREVLDLCQFEIRRAAVIATLKLGSRAAIVEADPIQIQQVLVNLIQNALQSMQSCPADSRRLVIELEVDDDWAEVSVTDSGPGFDVADLDAPFAAFHTTKVEGLGVGLSICRTIIDAHGGEIRIHPAEQGAHLSFRLPLALPRTAVGQNVPSAQGKSMELLTG
jgi:two-component system sensor kinase FixL